MAVEKAWRGAREGHGSSRPNVLQHEGSARSKQAMPGRGKQQAGKPSRRPGTPRWHFFFAPLDDMQGAGLVQVPHKAGGRCVELGGKNPERNLKRCDVDAAARNGHAEASAAPSTVTGARGLANVPARRAAGRVRRAGTRSRVRTWQQGERRGARPAGGEALCLLCCERAAGTVPSLVQCASRTAL